MERKKAAFGLIKEASLTADDKEAGTNFEAEMTVTKEIFRDSKNDLVSIYARELK